jgi:hypothetical protein
LHTGKSNGLPTVNGSITDAIKHVESSHSGDRHPARKGREAPLQGTATEAKRSKATDAACAGEGPHERPFANP